jgi:hypothetical protein
MYKVTGARIGHPAVGGRGVIVGPPAADEIIIIIRFSRGIAAWYDRKGSDLVQVCATRHYSPILSYIVVVLLLLYALRYVTRVPKDLTVKKSRPHRIVYIVNILVGFRGSSSGRSGPTI